MGSAAFSQQYTERGKKRGRKDWGEGGGKGNEIRKWKDKSKVNKKRGGGVQEMACCLSLYTLFFNYCTFGHCCAFSDPNHVTNFYNTCLYTLPMLYFIKAKCFYN